MSVDDIISLSTFPLLTYTHSVLTLCLTQAKCCMWHLLPCPFYIVSPPHLSFSFLYLTLVLNSSYGQLLSHSVSLEPQFIPQQTPKPILYSTFHSSFIDSLLCTSVYTAAPSSTPSAASPRLLSLTRLRLTKVFFTAQLKWHRIYAHSYLSPSDTWTEPCVSVKHDKKTV